MIRRVINSKGGLHNRVTETIRLVPFDLGETKRYLQSRQVFLDNRQIIELYMAFGGIPAYLSMVQPGLSSSQIINQLCFTSGEHLTEEFNRLFGSLFGKHQNHVKIVRTLAAAPKGLTRQEIVAKCGFPSGGASSLFLRELEESGFIASQPRHAKKSKGRFYRLSDEYSLFYLILPEMDRTGGSPRIEHDRREPLAAAERAAGLGGMGGGQKKRRAGRTGRSGHRSGGHDREFVRAEVHEG